MTAVCALPSMSSSFSLDSSFLISSRMSCNTDKIKSGEDENQRGRTSLLVDSHMTCGGERLTGAELPFGSTQVEDLPSVRGKLSVFFRER